MSDSSMYKTGKNLYIEEMLGRDYGHLFKKWKTPSYMDTIPTLIFIRDLETVYRQGVISFELPTGLKNKKSHDLENLLAAYALCAELGVDGYAFLKAWRLSKSHPIESNLSQK